MTPGGIAGDSAANGLMVNIETPPRGDSKSAAPRCTAQKGLCRYRESECLSKRIAARSPSTQVQGAASPATVPGIDQPGLAAL